MKIRIKGNSLRYRLTRSEVAELSQKGKLEDQTDFIGGTLCYAIEQTDSTEIKADFVQNKMTLYIPKQSIWHWASSEQVGIEHDMPLGSEKMLYLLLEKDFKCIDGDVNEDQSDYFDNPQISC